MTGGCFSRYVAIVAVADFWNPLCGSEKGDIGSSKDNTNLLEQRGLPLAGQCSPCEAEWHFCVALEDPLERVLCEICLQQEDTHSDDIMRHTPIMRVKIQQLLFT